MDTLIQINRLLMEREDRLVEISDLERQMGAILGTPYPLAPPDGLPSLRKPVKKPARKPAPPKAAEVRVRKLDETAESAYRITYREGGTEKTEIHFDARPLALLANTALPNLAVLSIETVQAEGTGWETVERLYRSDL